MRFSALILALMLGSSSVAHAQDDEGHVAEARALFQQGSTLAEARRFSEALDAFERSLALVERPSTLFNVALCLFALDRLVEVIEVLERYRSSEDVSTESLVDTERMLAHAERSVGQLVIEIVPEEASVFVDGREVEGGARRTVRVNQGPHVIRADAPGHAPQLVQLDAEPGVITLRGIQLESTRVAPRLAVSIADRPEATITVDGEAIGIGRGAVELEAGPHEVRVDGPSGDPIVRQVELRWNERLRLDLSAPPPSPETDGWSEPALWVGVGAGAAAVALGIAVALLAPPIDGSPSGGSTGVVLSLDGPGSVEIGRP